MSLEHTRAYKAAYLTYLRTGLPIELSLKHAHQTPQYVWETRGDAKVRLSHRRNEGKIFRWDTPPPTGHPGQDYNCRCLALPYEEGKTEYAYFLDTDSLASSGRRWTDLDFVEHFYRGGGRPVTLSEIGQFAEIVQEYAYFSDGDGAYHRLKGQIADWARNPKELSYRFAHDYSFETVAFSHGRATVDGEFIGSVVSTGDMLKIDGICEFNFYDKFTDPTDTRQGLAKLRSASGKLRNLLVSLGLKLSSEPDPPAGKLKPEPDDVPALLMALTELGGDAYEVAGHWQAQFHALVRKDRASSAYYGPDRH